MTAMPWADLLRAGVRHLGLTPQAFWQMSLAEWNLLARTATPPCIPRETFEALMARYPDRQSDTQQ